MDVSSEYTEPVDEQLQASYQELAQLASSLAHEIKNPLSVIRMNMELLAEDFEASDTPQDHRALGKMQVVQDQCTRLEKLLNDFIKFARLRELELAPGSLNEQIELVLDLFAPQASEQGVEIIRYLDNKLPGIRLESQTLHAALLNLVKNAIEAMPNGGELTAITRQTRDGVALDLIDSGCGMAAATAGRMFEAFFTTKEGGSGLGLLLARKVVEAHGGRIGVQSEQGRGTKFILEFPVPVRLAE
ncbi:MAG: ATP-binding protein [Pirellulaceae bacterium]